MKKLITLIALFVCFEASAQSTTFIIGQKKIDLSLFNQLGKRIGRFTFDSTTGKFNQSGNQIKLFRNFMWYIQVLQQRMELADNVLQYIEPDGSIRYPIEFKEAWLKWYNQNQRTQ